uniref:Uncharacterized protein n=1 Tax=Phalansterium sp. PJK-2012 TaxID=1267188 RepID=T1QDV0_9EUKA|nr:hypothetical protein [Phalansterium sp. PJK-2012]
MVKSSQLEGAQHNILFIENMISEFGSISPAFLKHGFTSVLEAALVVAFWGDRVMRLDEEYLKNWLDYKQAAYQRIISLDNCGVVHHSKELDDFVGLTFADIIDIVKQYVTIFMIREQKQKDSKKLDSKILF